MLQPPEEICAYSYTWTIKNLALFPLSIDKPIFSPSFTTETWGNSKWRLLLYPKGQLESDYMSLYLQRGVDGSEQKEIVMDLRFTMENLSTRVSFEKTHTDTCLREGSVAGFTEFTRWNSFNTDCKVSGKTLLPFDTLSSIRCEMSLSQNTANDGTWNPRVDFRFLTIDLTRLFVGGRHHDIVLYSGRTEFRAHKAVLASRSPKFMRDLYFRVGPDSCARMDMSAVPAPILHALLLFLYSGDLDIPEGATTQGLRALAAQYEVVDLTRRMRSSATGYRSRTDVQFERKHVTWAVAVSSLRDDDFLGFRRVLKCERVSCDELVICCQIIDDLEPVYRTYIQMSFQLTGVRPRFHVSMTTHVHVNNSAGTNSSVELHQEQRVFDRDSEWCHVSKIDNVFEESTILRFGFEIGLCDGTTETFLLDEDTPPDAYPIGMNDCHNFSYDFQKLLYNYTFTDFSIVCGGETFQAHKAVLSVRSPVFEKMLEHDMIEKRNGSVVVHDIRPGVIRLMLVYMYSGFLGDLTLDDLCDLYEAADKYAILILRDRCRYVLSTRLNADDVGRILDLAKLHFDSNMEFAAMNYIHSWGSYSNRPFSGDCMYGCVAPL